MDFAWCLELVHWLWALAGSGPLGCGAAVMSLNSAFCVTPWGAVGSRIGLVSGEGKVGWVQQNAVTNSDGVASTLGCPLSGSAVA